MLLAEFWNAGFERPLTALEDARSIVLLFRTARGCLELPVLRSPGAEQAKRGWTGETAIS